MKRAALILAALAAILTAAAAPVRTATEGFVANKIAEAVAAIPAPDYSTSNAALVATIEATAPAPGNYATVSNRAMTALQSFREIDPTVPAWAKSPSKPSYSAAEVGAVSLDGGRLNIGAGLSFGVAGNGLDIDMGGIEISDEDEGRNESLYIDYNSITHTSPNGDRQTLTFPLEASDFDAYTRGEVNAISATIPNNITRTATDATLVHTDGGRTTNLITIRQASETLAGLMTAADKVKLDAATTPADVTALIRTESLCGIWDETLQVWWTPRMRNGSLTYEATTNVNLNAEN